MSNERQVGEWVGRGERGGGGTDRETEISTCNKEGNLGSTNKT